MSSISICKWAEYQHYKSNDRTPAWIKLHYDTLSSRSWIMASNDDRVLMVTLMLLAARYKNAIPNDPAFIQRVAHLPRQPNFDNLIAAGFIEVDGDPVQPRPASRVNGKREKKADRFEEFWQLYPRKVKKKQALRTWETRDLDSMADRILAHVKTCASSSQWVRENGKFVPHPTTYLNGDRWEDEAAGERRTDDLPVLEADRLW